MKRLFGTDGIRGIVNEELTVETAMGLGNAIARLYNGKYKTLYLAQDTRNSGKLFETAIAAGAMAAGMDVQSCGIIPTPALAFITKQKKAIGIVISASHNPSIYNGLKVIADGFKIPDEEEIEIENIILKGELEYTPYGEIGDFKKDTAKRLYLNYILNTYKDVKSNFRFAVDIGNGAAGTVIEDVIETLGLNCDIYFNEPDGFNINDKCGSTEPDKLGRIIRDNKYDFGVLFDGDADRCLFLDKNGKLIDGDKLMAINSFKLKEMNRLHNETVVATVMSNLGFEEYLKQHGIKLLRTQVGDKYVLERMLETSANIGGEQSGHIIFLDRATTGDGLITALETIDTLTYFNKSLDELVAEIPEYPQKLKNVSVKDKKRIMEDKRMKEIITEYDDVEDYRLLVRPSGTEHKIRVMAEGKNAELVETSVDEICLLIETIDKE